MALEALDALEALLSESLSDRPVHLIRPFLSTGTTVCNLQLLRSIEPLCGLSVSDSTPHCSRPLTPLSVNPIALKHALVTTLESITSKLHLALQTLQSDLSLLDPPIFSAATVENRSFVLDSLTPIHRIVGACVRSAADHITPENTRCILERSIELTTLDLGIQFYATEPLNNTTPATVTLCGTIFVIDIEFGNDSHVSKVNLSIASSVNLTNSQAESLILDQLRLRKLNDFKQTLALLSFLDTTSIPGQVDLFQCISWIEKDLSDIFALEMSMPEQTVGTVMVSGHGVPRFHQEQWGPSILYWCHPSRTDILQDPITVSKETESKCIYKAFVSMEHSTETVFLAQSCTQYLITPSTQADVDILGSSLPTSMSLGGNLLRFLDPTHANACTANASFVLQLAPPIVVTLEAAKELMRINNDGMDGSDNIFESYTDLMKQYTPLQQSISIKSKIQQDQSSVFAFPESILKTPALIASRIPFTSPVQLSRIYSILRQHIVFQHLYCSMFTPLPTDHRQYTFDVVYWCPPVSIGISFMYSIAPYAFQMHTKVDTQNAHVDVECLCASQSENGMSEAVEWVSLNLSNSEHVEIKEAVGQSLNIMLGIAAFKRILDSRESMMQE
ncbi:hypothetical protein BDV3_005429 [Batrachochytrium dendrobatidis]|nr:hypothetical protein O5D80_003512 [Batrachochytrium dendrobatidis]KAK5673206.1 hypothetical protein QVD99_000660 [Batrachochytrium dendrobatidis]